MHRRERSSQSTASLKFTNPRPDASGKISSNRCLSYSALHQPTNRSVQLRLKLIFINRYTLIRLDLRQLLGYVLLNVTVGDTLPPLFLQRRLVSERIRVSITHHTVHRHAVEEVRISMIAILHIGRVRCARGTIPD